MKNPETQATWLYHNSTKHSPLSVRSSRHFLDFTNQPRSYKLYQDLEALPLTKDSLGSNTSAFSALLETGPEANSETVPDLKTLTSILHHSVGIIKWLSIPGGRMAFRAAACTGALYHVELYVVCGDVPGLEAGVYQFGVHDMALRRLRSGDFREFLAKAAGGDVRVAEAPVTMVCSSTYWRNSWKYQARTYRHCFWDSGTILANMLAMASAHQLPAGVIAGFVDGQVNLLLDLDDKKEVALSLVPFGYAPSMRPGPSPEVKRLNMETVPVSRSEIDYPAIREMHSASSLETPEEVSDWKTSTFSTTELPPSGKTLALEPLQTEALPRDSIERVIERRGSSRRFERTPISLQALSTLLAAAARGVKTDFLDQSHAMLNDIYLIANCVDRLDSGTYVFHPQTQTLENLKTGNFREEAGYLALDQELGADAAVNFYFLADLEPILAKMGNRGYRVAQLDASISAGRLYLAAYGLRIGATGLTFFDDDVIDFFSPHAHGKSVMFLLAVGAPSKQRPI